MLTVPLGWFLRNPPEGFVPAGWTPPAKQARVSAAGIALEAKDCILSGRFLLLWLVFFCNITAGIAIIVLPVAVVPGFVA